AEDHERGGAVVPALADVRAIRFLAHRVQPELAHDALEPEIVLRPRRADLEPLGLGHPRSGVTPLLAATDEGERDSRHLRSKFSSPGCPDQRTREPANPLII